MNSLRVLIIFLSLLILKTTGISAEMPSPNPFPPDPFYNPQGTLEEAITKLNLSYTEFKKKAHENFKAEKEFIRDKRVKKKISLKRADISYALASKRLEDRLAFLEKKFQSTKSILTERYALQVEAEKTKTHAETSRNYSQALVQMEQECADLEKNAQDNFYKEKRKIERSLSSLEKSESDKRSELKKAQKNLGSELAQIKNDCIAKETQLKNKIQDLALRIEKESQIAWKKEMAHRKKQEKELRRQARKKPVEPLPLEKPEGEERPSKIQTLFTSLKLHGILSEEVAYRTSNPDQFSKIKSMVNLSQSTRWSDNLRFKFSERAYYDAVFSGTDRYKDEVEDDQQWEVELRDAFFDYSMGPMDWRIGKQQIVWGDAMAIFVADVVNGKDLREYILPDFEQVRINQWSGVMNFTQGNFTGEFLFSKPEFHKLGKAGSEFEFMAPVPAGTVVNKKIEPESFPKHGDMGGKMNILLGGLDLGMFYLYSWEKFPIYVRELNGSYTPSYLRKDIVGLTFSKDVVADSILKGELAVVPNQPYNVFDPLDVDGVDRRSTVNYVLGIDHTFFEKWESNFQILQQLIDGSDRYLINQKSRSTHGSFWLKTDIAHGKLEPQVIAIFGLDRKDHLIRPKIVWNCTDNIRFHLGADVFIGQPQTGLFGIFENRDRIYSNLEFHF